MPGCNNEAITRRLDEIAFHIAPGAHAVLLLDQAGWHGSAELVVPPNIYGDAAPAQMPRVEPRRERMAVHARQLFVESHLQIPRQYN